MLPESRRTGDMTQMSGAADAIRRTQATLGGAGWGMSLSTAREASRKPSLHRTHAREHVPGQGDIVNVTPVGARETRQRRTADAAARGSGRADAVCHRRSGRCDVPGHDRVLLAMRAEQLAGPKQQGRKTDRHVVYHGTQKGRVVLRGMATGRLEAAAEEAAMPAGRIRRCREPRLRGNAEERSTGRSHARVRDYR